jgi:hypothetical protein
VVAAQCSQAVRISLWALARIALVLACVRVLAQRRLQLRLARKRCPLSSVPWYRLRENSWPQVAQGFGAMGIAGRPI